MSEIRLTTIKRLFALSGNMCAFPECQNPIIEESGTITGEICHIKSKSPNGPRYDSEQTDEQRDGYENLILLCRRHHKNVDTEPDLYDVGFLVNIKRVHEKKNAKKESEKDFFFAKMLLDDMKRISIKNNTGNVIIDSPGAIQGDTINIKTTKAKVSVNPPVGSIGADVNYSGYIQHLIKRYNEFARSDPFMKRKFYPGAVSKNIADKFGTQWKLLSIDKLNEIIEYLQNRILRTSLAKINKGKGIKSFSTFEEYLQKYSH